MLMTNAFIFSKYKNNKSKNENEKKTKKIKYNKIVGNLLPTLLL